MGVPLKLSGACAAKYAVSTRAPSQIVAPTPPRPPVSALGCIPQSPRVSAMPNNADEAYGTCAEFGYCHHNTDASQPPSCQIHLCTLLGEDDCLPEAFRAPAVALLQSGAGGQASSDPLLDGGRARLLVYCEGDARPELSR